MSMLFSAPSEPVLPLQKLLSVVHLHSPEFSRYKAPFGSWHEIGITQRFLLSSSTFSRSLAVPAGWQLRMRHCFLLTGRHCLVGLWQPTDAAGQSLQNEGQWWTRDHWWSLQGKQLSGVGDWGRGSDGQRLVAMGVVKNWIKSSSEWNNIHKSLLIGSLS